MHVMKFGGSSVADATNISKVLDIVGDVARRDKVILVCSAIKGCTDTLLNSGVTPELIGRHENIIRRLFTGKEREDILAECRKEFAQLTPKTLHIEAYGEIFSTKIIAKKLACDGVRTLWIDSRSLIRAEGCKVIESLSYPYIMATVDAHPEIDVFVAPGFICSDKEGLVNTLGRGGSDYSAAILAAGSKASDLEIWTDVPGIMTTNPKDVPAARTISNISYKAALDLARYGAKVLYPPTITPAMEAGIAINIRNTFDPSNPGTVISDKCASEVPVWKGVASCGSDGKSTLHIVGEGNPDAEAALERTLSILKKAGVRVIASAIEDGNVSITVDSAQEREALKAIHKDFFEQKKTSVLDIYVDGYGASYRYGVTLYAPLIKSGACKVERYGGGLGNLPAITTDCNEAGSAVVTPDGKYVCILHPSVAYDLRQDPDWVAAHQYAAAPAYNAVIESERRETAAVEKGIIAHLAERFRKRQFL